MRKPIAAARAMISQKYLSLINLMTSLAASPDKPASD
jgi:hypothetical protein